MNPEDQIVEEVRAAREAYAARFNFDLAAMYQDLKARERESGHIAATLKPAEPEREMPAPN
jgi:hypothetical protein